MLFEAGVVWCVCVCVCGVGVGGCVCVWCVSVFGDVIL